LADAGPCQTLTYAIGQTDQQNPTVTLNATIDGGGGNWGANETYPIECSQSIVLKAPGVYFTDTGGNSEVFTVWPYPGDLTIQGSAAAPVVIGSDNAGNLTSDPISIFQQGTLTLDNVIVYEASGNIGIYVDVPPGWTAGSPGATLHVIDLGLGGNLPNGITFGTVGGTGIKCQGGGGVWGGAGVYDDFASAAPSLVSRGQNVSIDAEDLSIVSLSWAPVFGWPTDGGYSSLGQGCSAQSPLDNIGIQANGDAYVEIGGAGGTATISCMTAWGVTSINSNSQAYPPSVELDANIENCSSAGIYVTAGSVYVSGGSIDHNLIGIDMESDGVDIPTVTLNDGTQTNNVTVACNSNQETGGTAPGIDVFNNSTGSLAADYVNWDHWFDPNGDATVPSSTDVFLCLDTSTCACDVFDSTGDAGCENSPEADGMDLVLGGSADAGPTGTATFTNGAASPNPCN
jgi:hypothetical protein